MPTFAGVDHFSLTVTDLETSHRFYTEVLGFVQVLDVGYGRIYMHNPAGFVLALIRHPQATGEPFTELHTGLDHLGFVASSLDELREWETRFRDMGVEFTPIREMEFGYHLNFRDPDNIALEFSVSNETFAAAQAMVRTGELSDEQIRQYAEQLKAQILDS